MSLVGFIKRTRKRRVGKKDYSPGNFGLTKKWRRRMELEKNNELAPEGLEEGYEEEFDNGIGLGDGWNQVECPGCHKLSPKIVGFKEEGGIIRFLLLFCDFCGNLKLTRLQNDDFINKSEKKTPGYFG